MVNTSSSYSLQDLEKKTTTPLFETGPEVGQFRTIAGMREIENILNVKLAKRAFVVVCLSSDSRLIRSCTGIQDEITVRSEFPVPNTANIGQNIKSS